uniref:RING-type domain-containing protein n=1 Tax=Globisporangium ultimum (strain ATCC 200006 / CBS 805.95 / DAOM BR144) TaxID=431595 RepID=K3WQ42_GLOUD
MFVMVNAGTDNPWLIALLLFVQVVVPILQSSAGSDDDDSQATNLLALFILGLALLSGWKLARFSRILRDMRGLYPHLSWLAFFKEAYARSQAQAAAAAEAARAARETANGGGTGGDATSSENFNKVMRMIQVMPTEEFKTPTELQHATICELKERLKRRDVAYAGCVERNELVDLLVEFRGGPSNNDTCCICCEEYQSGDVMRLLRKCKHEFHLECLDKWAFSSVNLQRLPSCPLCNQALE